MEGDLNWEDDERENSVITREVYIYIYKNIYRRGVQRIFITIGSGVR